MSYTTWTTQDRSTNLSDLYAIKSSIVSYLRLAKKRMEAWLAYSLRRTEKKTRYFISSVLPKSLRYLGELVATPASIVWSRDPETDQMTMVVK